MQQLGDLKDPLPIASLEEDPSRAGYNMFKICFAVLPVPIWNGCPLRMWDVQIGRIWEGI